MKPDQSRVLIADRDVYVRQQLYGALLEMNVFSDCVGTTGDALAKLAEEPYGVILIDIELPPGNVGDVLRKVAEMAPRERPVVLALAAQPETARSLDVEIVQIVLRRPIQLRQLLDLIASCLRSVGKESSRATAESPDGDHATS
jgi:DNA-binding response OmpR family regulator